MEIIKVIMTMMAAMLVAALLIIWRCFAIQLLWGWFVTTTYGMVAPSLPMIIGAYFIARLFTFSPNAPNEYRSSDDKKWGTIGAAATGPAMFIIAGFIAKQFI